MKNRRNSIATSTATLTQSGLLAALLKHQRSKVIELAQRRAQQEHVNVVFRSSLAWLMAAGHSITAALRLRRGLAAATVARRT